MINPGPLKKTKPLELFYGRTSIRPILFSNWNPALVKCFFLHVLNLIKSVFYIYHMAVFMGVVAMLANKAISKTLSPNFTISPSKNSEFHT